MPVTRHAHAAPHRTEHEGPRQAARRDAYKGALPDSADFRDRLYVPALVDVPLRLPPEVFCRFAGPVLDQGIEPSCTGFGLAAVAHFLLRRRRVDPDEGEVSARMLYEMAKRYDEWPGTNYKGSSTRGAIKGWHKHGVCSAELWPYVENDDRCVLTRERVADALRRPLGAYFRVDARNLAMMHAALAEVGALYVMAMVHEGWHKVGKDGIIPWPDLHLGSHAFAIVGYDEQGFWLQNSKGAAWGRDGYARISYDDWLANGKDAWVLQLGVPIALAAGGPSGAARPRATSHHAHSFAALRPHILSLAADGAPRRTGTFATDAADIAEIVGREVPARMKKWKTRRILLFAPSGLADEAATLRWIEEQGGAFLNEEIYPLLLDWDTGFASALGALVATAAEGAGAGGAGKHPMAHRLDDTIEARLRRGGGPALWQRLGAAAAHSAESGAGGLRRIADALARLAAEDAAVEIHLLAHGTGAVLIAALAALLAGKKPAGLGCRIASTTLWAPACTIARFDAAVAPALADGGLARLALFTLATADEEADRFTAGYGRSLLSLIGNALEERARIPDHSEATSMLGVTTAVAADGALSALLRRDGNLWVVAGPAEARSAARHHQDFATDAPTFATTVTRIKAAPA